MEFGVKSATERSLGETWKAEEEKVYISLVTALGRKLKSSLMASLDSRRSFTPAAEATGFSVITVFLGLLKRTLVPSALLILSNFSIQGLSTQVT